MSTANKISVKTKPVSTDPWKYLSEAKAATGEKIIYIGEEGEDARDTGRIAKKLLREKLERIYGK